MENIKNELLSLAGIILIGFLIVVMIIAVVKIVLNFILKLIKLLIVIMLITLFFAGRAEASEIPEKYQAFEVAEINTGSGVMLELENSVNSFVQGVVIKYFGSDYTEMTTEKLKVLCNRAIDKNYIAWQNLDQFSCGVLPDTDSCYFCVSWSWRADKGEIENTENTLDKIVMRLKNDKQIMKMSEIDRVKLIADIVSRMYDYDKELKKTSFYVSGAVSSRRAVCQAYSVTFNYIASKCGIMSKIVVSDDENHSLNMVRIGNRELYVDVTNYDYNNFDENQLLYSDCRFAGLNTNRFGYAA